MATVKWSSRDVKKNPNIYIELIKESFYEEGGKLLWRVRPRGHFQRDCDHTRHKNSLANTEAGHVIQRRNTYYRRVKFLGATIETHIILWVLYYNEFPKGHIDHIDGDGLNNSQANLRDFDNEKNKVFNKKNKSGVVGVYWYEPFGVWRVTGGRKQVFSSTDWFEAVCFRKSWEIKNGYTVR